MENLKETISIEEYAKSGKMVPKAQKYQIRVDRENYIVEKECMTGKEILQLAGKLPVEKYQLNEKLNKGTVRKIGYDETVCFTEPGIERFMTLPLDSTEG